MTIYGAPAMAAGFLKRVFSTRRSGEAAPAGSRALMAVALALLVSGSVNAHAQHYPERPIKLIVPYAPGGATDSFARLVGEQLGKALGKPFVIDNRRAAPQ